MVYENCFAVEDGDSAKKRRLVTNDVVFRNQDVNGVEASTLDPLMIMAMIRPTIVKQVLINYGKSLNILFKKTYGQTKWMVGT